MGEPAPFGVMEMEPNETKLQELAGRLVAQEVCYCVSALVNALGKLDAHAEALQPLFGREGYADPDDLCALAYRQPDADDYRDQCPTIGGASGGDRVQMRQTGEGFEWRDAGEIDCDDDEGGWSDTFDTELEAWRDAFDSLGFDQPDGREIYEHWLVTDWFAEKLSERGESVVRDFAGLTIWGRSTTGQAISMDSVIRAIVRDLHADEFAPRTTWDRMPDDLRTMLQARGYEPEIFGGGDVIASRYFKDAGRVWITNEGDAPLPSGFVICAYSADDADEPLADFREDSAMIGGEPRARLAFADALDAAENIAEGGGL